MHTVDPVEDWKVLPPQLVHTVAEAAEYMPIAQAPVTAVRPVVAQYDPAVHAMHALNPVAAENVPAKQLEHDDDDDEAE